MSRFPPLAIRAWLRWDVVSRMLHSTQPQAILEIGCGRGAMGARLCEGRAYTALELDEASFLAARANIAPRGGLVHHGSTGLLAPEAKYDLVCAFEVLEHIEDDHGALIDWAARVRPGGHLMISVPAFRNRYGPSDELAGHFRRYDPDDLRQVIQSVGFEVREMTTYGWPLTYATDFVRTHIDAWRLRDLRNRSKAELTAASGRTFQPSTRAADVFTQIGTLPFRRLQRLRPTIGNGLVVLAEMPAKTTR